MATHTSLNSLFTDIADSIRAKTGSTETIVADNFPTEITNIPSGGGIQIPEHGVFFIDYDGSIVEAWESSSVASKASLPDNPTHTGLTAQGWNWTLQSIKDYIEDYPRTNIYVGQMYKTTSGLTEFDIVLTKVTGLTVYCGMVGKKDWGDGTSNTSTSHTYNDYGKYTITCNGTSINTYVFGSYGNGLYLCVEVRISDTVTSVGDRAFYNCTSLQNITIPSSITSIGNYVFNSCYSLRSITIPSSITSIGDYVFNGCYSLQNITIPNSITSIGKNAFTNCYSLRSITIPSSITSIGNNAFAGCYSTIKYDFSNSSSIPTLVNTNAFQYINAISKIIVPDVLYDDWIIATNWSTYANYIYKASEVE